MLSPILFTLGALRAIWATGLNPCAAEKLWVGGENFAGGYFFLNDGESFFWQADAAVV